MTLRTDDMAHREQAREGNSNEGDTTMTTTTENQTAKPKQVPDFYIFENADGSKGSKPAGAAF